MSTKEIDWNIYLKKKLLKILTLKIHNIEKKHLKFIIKAFINTGKFIFIWIAKSIASDKAFFLSLNQMNSVIVV